MIGHERNGGRLALVLDVGTTGVKALVFDEGLGVVAKSYLPLGKERPRPGWVEQDPAELVAKAVRVMRGAMRGASRSARALAGVGITNQRETTVLWDARSGRPVAPAIVWEDRRTARACVPIRAKHGALIRKKTGLAVDPYFSATKVRWLLDHEPGAVRLAERGRLAFGTVDALMLRRLCADAPHRTDVTNASRTLLYDIVARRWDPELLRIFGVPRSILPEVMPSRAAFGALHPRILGAAVPVVAVCGDQQASAYAAAREARRARIPGPVTKVTFGTGIFLSQEVPDATVRVPGFFTTLTPGPGGRPVAAIEQKIGDCAAEVSRRLGDDRALRRYFASAAAKVAALVRRLPAVPSGIVIDGGAARDGIAAAALEAATGIPTHAQRIFDGTALGAAMLVFGGR